MTGPKIVKFPVAPSVLKELVKDVLTKALAADLPNVIVLSQDDEGVIHYFESEDMTVAQANWLLDLYKLHLLTATTIKD